MMAKSISAVLSMKAVLLRRFGGPEALEIVDVADPVLRPGEILVRVKAAGVNYFEVLMREGRYGFSPTLPMIPGVEIAGVVEEADPGTGFAIGSRVAVPLFAAGASGGYAELVAVDASTVHPVPEGLPFDVAVALMVQGLTALHAVRRSCPADKTVLIPAAAGGVGSLLIQLARRHRARRVIAAVGSEKKRDVARNLGADIAVLYDSPGWGADLRAVAGDGGIDIVYDFVGGAIADEYLSVIAPEGELLFGALGRADIDRQALNAMIGQNQSLKGLALIPLLTPENLKADLAELFSLAVRDELQVPIGARYPIGEVATAHRMIEARITTGKTVLLP
jgi:NADPH2:quinone reductase